MSMKDLCVARLTDPGWLALSSIYFDNSYVITVYSTRGYVAYSPSEECFFSSNSMDSTDTANIEARFNIIDGELSRRHIGMQQTVTCISIEHMQHFDYANYSHYCFYWDEQIPTEAELDAFTLDPDVPTEPDPEDPFRVKPIPHSLYLGNGLDTTVMLDGRELSTIPLYKDFETKYHLAYSGAIVGEWKMWYNNHKKFKQMLSEAYGVSDAI